MDDQEVRRQQALIAAIGGAPPIGLRETGARAARGLEAYRAHAEASAERALRAALPTVQALLGDELRARCRNLLQLRQQSENIKQRAMSLEQRLLSSMHEVEERERTL